MLVRTSRNKIKDNDNSKSRHNNLKSYYELIVLNTTILLLKIKLYWTDFFSKEYWKELCLVKRKIRSDDHILILNYDCVMNR